MNIELTIARVVAAEELWTVTFHVERRFVAGATGPTAAVAIQQAKESLRWALGKPAPFGALRR